VKERRPAGGPDPADRVFLVTLARLLGVLFLAGLFLWLLLLWSPEAGAVVVMVVIGGVLAGGGPALYAYDRTDSKAVGLAVLGAWTAAAAAIGLAIPRWLW
jgi:hypothetical protein